MLDDIFNDDSDEGTNIDLLGSIDLEVIDTSKVSIKSKEEAKNLINGVYEYFLEEKLIKNNTYIKAKQTIEESTLSGIIKQLYLLETSITNYIQIINIDPTKVGYIQFIIGMQKMYREFSREVNMLIRNISEELKEIQSTEAIEIPKTPSQTQNEENVENENNSGGGNIIRGTRDMNDRIRARIIEQKKRLDEGK